MYKTERSAAMKNYIGMDVHSKTCTFVVVNAQGKEVASQRVQTTESQILKFVRSIKGTKALTFEESNLSKWLHPLLQNEVDKLVVCNPSFVTRRTGAKNDYLDTSHLAQQLRGDFLTPVFHENNVFSELRSVVSAYEDLVRDTTRAKNRYKALFRSQAHETKGSTIYSNADRILELKSEADRFVAQALFSQIQSAVEAKKSYLDRFKKYCDQHGEIKALTSIPGVSSTRATIIAAIVCSPKRFANKYKFWSYCMLVKHDCNSDGKSYGKVSTHGNSSLKNVFMGAAQRALDTDRGLKKRYDQMRAQGVDHWTAKKQIARKIAAIALAVMRTKNEYRENYEIKKRKRA
jgi:transposase